jgi:TetR/AcrR family transcriptional regulator, transcriptional repressor for nem operon
MPVQKITREEIIQIAAQVFRQQGYHKTSMADLAEACGLTKGIFYHYFPGKEELMKEALQTIHRYFTARIFAIAYQNDLSGRERMKQMLVRSDKFFTDGEGGCFMGNTVLETVGVIPEFAEVLRAFFSDWVAAVQHIYEEKYQTAEARKIAEQTIQELQGAVMFMRLFADKEYLKNAARNALARCSV